jgi:hypothetical protein
MVRMSVRASARQVVAERIQGSDYSLSDGGSAPAGAAEAGAGRCTVLKKRGLRDDALGGGPDDLPWMDVVPPADPEVFKNDMAELRKHKVCATLFLQGQNPSAVNDPEVTHQMGGPQERERVERLLAHNPRTFIHPEFLRGLREFRDSAACKVSDDKASNFHHPMILGHGSFLPSAIPWLQHQNPTLVDCLRFGDEPDIMVEIPNGVREELGLPPGWKWTPDSKDVPAGAISTTSGSALARVMREHPHLATGGPLMMPDYARAPVATRVGPGGMPMPMPVSGGGGGGPPRPYSTAGPKRLRSNLEG